jgi:ribonuclease HI
MYTDGSCSGNPGPGGWGAVIVKNGKVMAELSGGEKNTTNNRMELIAAIRSLQYPENPASVVLYTDSEYVKNGITKWISAWRKNGWKTSANKPVKNKDLWEELVEASERHDVSWQWVKGHAGNKYNERADSLATAESGAR